MAKTHNPVRRIALRELCLFLCLLFFGLVVLPIGVYLVGDQVFGTYAASGFTGFFGEISSKIRGGDWDAWFLVLAPYLGWQVIRLTALLWRLIGQADDDRGRNTA